MNPLLQFTKNALALRFVFSHKHVSGFLYRSDVFHHAAPSVGEADRVDRSALEHFHNAAKWALREWICVSDGPVIIEPSFGWAVSGRSLIPESLYNVWVQGSDLPTISFSKFALHRLLRRSRKLKEAICLLYASSNYWHFHNNVAENLLMFQQHGVLTPGIPVIVPASLRDAPFFSDFLNHSSFLRQINWQFQRPGEFFEVGRAYFSDTIWGKTKNFSDVAGLLELPRAQPTAACRIYVTRRGCSRAAENEQSVEELLKDYGFVTVNCSELTMPQQAHAFGRAEYIVGLHGAALTNLVHNKQHGTKLLELMPEDWLNPCYYWMARDLGMTYSCLITSPVRKSADMATRVDTDRLEQKLDMMLAPAGASPGFFAEGRQGIQDAW